jgi:hypothetical protein
MKFPIVLLARLRFAVASIVNADVAAFPRVYVIVAFIVILPEAVSF